MNKENIRVAVIGLKGTHHHDDAVGSAVALRMRGAARGRVDVFEHSGGPEALCDVLAEHDLVILVDSCCTGCKPGTVLRLDGNERPGYADWFPHYSMHTAGWCDAFSLNNMMGNASARLLLFCVEGNDYSAGDGLSPEVEASVDRVVQLLLGEVASAANKAPRIAVGAG